MPIKAPWLRKKKNLYLLEIEPPHNISPWSAPLLHGRESNTVTFLHAMYLPANEEPVNVKYLIAATYEMRKK